MEPCSPPGTVRDLHLRCYAVGTSSLQAALLLWRPTHPARRPCPRRVGHEQRHGRQRHGRQRHGRQRRATLPVQLSPPPLGPASPCPALVRALRRAGLQRGHSSIATRSPARPEDRAGGADVPARCCLDAWTRHCPYRVRSRKDAGSAAATHGHPVRTSPWRARRTRTKHRSAPLARYLGTSLMYHPPLTCTSPLTCYP